MIDEDDTPTVRAEPAAVDGSTDAASLSPARLAAVRALEVEALLDSPPEEAFDRLTRIASSVLGVPVALVSLVDADRQFFKSAVGLPEPWASARETPLSHSFCQHVVERQQPLIVEDARMDPLTRDNAAIDDIGVVAYAGFPIRTADDTVVGSLCAIDGKPRRWTPAQLDVLRELAELAHTELVLRGALREADSSARRARRATAEREAVIESTSDGIYAIDLTGRCTLANAAAIALIGYSAPELLGVNMHDLIHHHHADRRVFDEAECPLYLAFREGRPTRIDDTTFWRRDGTSFRADCTSSPLIMDGRMTGAVIAFRDISERIAAAEALRQSEMRFRAVFQDAGIGIVITDLDGTLLECNEAYERVTGYSRIELLSSSYAQVTHPEDTLAQRQLADEMLAGVREQLRMEKRYVRKSGEMIWARLTATVMREDDGTPRFIIGAVEDITAARRSAHAVALLADAGAILSSSLEYESTLGQVARRAVPFLGEACVMDVPREDGSSGNVCVHIEPQQEARLCALQNGSPLLPSDVLPEESEGNGTVASLVDLAERRGSVAASAASCLGILEEMGIRWLVRAPLPGPHGNGGSLTFGSATLRYSADELRLAEELAARVSAAIENAALYRQAQNATRARDDVLAVVSHDLRNPVHTITMAASLMEEVPELSAAIMQSQIAVIRRSAARADRLIRDLLDISRIENGQLRLERKPVDAAELVREAAQLVAAQATARDITLKVADAGEPMVALGDRHRLLQALDNLLGNALKFTPAKGTIEVAAAAKGDTVSFEVRDSGPGVAPELQEKLFQRFWQAKPGDRRGVGLGLSIVKGIVDAHEGTIRIDSDGIHGTSIRFTIATAPSEQLVNHE